MAITAKDIEQLQEYADGVMGRAAHHAGKVKGAALTLLGGIIWRAEAGTIRMRQYAGSPANMIWVKIGGKDYAFRYDHKTQQIEIRDGAQNGPLLHSIDDTMAVADIQAILEAL